MKKVLFVATVVKTHIMQFHVPYLEMFRQMGWETAVAARNDYEDPKDCVIPHCDTYYDIPFERFPLKPANLRAYRQLKAVIEEGDYDIIHCHTPVGAMVARLAAIDARKRGTRVIYTAHGFHFFKGAPLLNWLLYYPVEWLLAGLTDVLITINREDYALAQKRLHPGRLVYVPGVGIDTVRFRHQNLDPGEKRRELGFAEEDFLLLTVAEMTKNKNHSTVLKALALLKQEPEFDRMHYLIVGRGENRSALEEETDRLGLRDHVHFLGYRNDIGDLCSSCDLFAFMSFREGLSVALMEAMACGMPTVCSRIRGNTDLIENGVEGILPENTPSAVAEAILTLCREPETRAALGAAAAKKIEVFDAKNVHKTMKEIYLNQ